VIGIYALVLAVTIGTGQLLRGHVIDSLQIDDGQARVTVFLAPVSSGTREAVVHFLADSELPGSIAYAAPSSWRIPELGFAGKPGPRGHAGIGELLHPTTHGNPLSFDQDRMTILLATASTARAGAEGLDRLKQALEIRPAEFVDLDITTGAVIDRRPGAEGYWAGIPVPTF
jgi:hypothetical protein